MSTNTVRIIGIDPGLRRTGWGVIESDGVRLGYVASGYVESDKDEVLAYRLRQIFEGVAGVIASFKPREAAVEETFVNDNARATLKLGQARGIAMLVPAQAGLAIGEYAPNAVKKAIVGVGHAEKHQIAHMIGIHFPGVKLSGPDAADALAIAITHAHHLQSGSRLSDAIARAS